MGASQTSTTNQTQTQTADPRMQAAVAPILSASTNVLNTKYNPGMNVNVAGLNQQQQSAIQGLGGLQSGNPASPFIAQADQYSRTAADPNSVIGMTNAFYNPMSSKVMDQLSNIQAQEAARLKGNEAASGAIGGSRASVADSTLANQQGLAAGQIMSQLYNQALQAAQTEQGQISQQAFTQGQLGNEALNTQIQGIMAALQGGNITQQQAQALYNAATQNSIQRTLFPQQEAAAAANIAGIGTTLGGTSTGQGTTSTPVNYANMIGGVASLGAGLMGGIGGGGGASAACGGTIKKRAEGGETSDAPNLESALASSPTVNVPQTHFPTLNLNPQKQGGSGQQQSGGLPGMGGLGSLGSSMSGGLSGLADSAGSALSGVGSAIGDAAGAIGSGIMDALPAIGEGIMEFLPALAFLADGGSVRKHRAIGGGTGIGNGTSGPEGYSGIPSPSSSGLNYNGIQSPLSAYFARSPQVNIPHVNLPTLNLGGGGQNNAQQQPFSDPKQMQALGQNLGSMGKSADQYFNADFGGGGADFAHGGRIHRQSGGPVASGFPQSIADAIQKHPDATSIKQTPDGGHNVQLQNGVGIKYPGQKQTPNSGTVKHRDDGGPVAAPWNFQSDSPSQDLIRAREQPMVFPTSAPLIAGPGQYKTASAPSPWADAPAIPLAGERAPQDVTAPSGLMADYLEHRRDPSYRPGWPTQIASINPVQGLPGDEGVPKLPDRLQPDNVTQQPIQQAAIASPAQTPPPVAQPKPVPQPRSNQQPQFGTPEWRNWADSYGRVSIQGETGRSSAFQGLGEINTHDTNGTHSYGNYGLNSGGSAQEFVRQYGLDGIGLTAQPGTAMFDMQWREAARNPASADILRRAEIDYYNKHYVNPTVSGMSQYLPVNIANSRAAQEYMIDKSVQQGTGTWDGNSGIGVKHIRRAQQAAEESGGDPVKFVQRMAQLDHAAVGSDFPAALHSGAYSPLGDLNRLHTRVAGALGELGEGIQALPGQIGSGIRSMFGAGNRSVLDRPDLQPPKPGESELDRRMAEFGFQPNQPQGLGGSLGRALGMNPSLSQQNSNRLVNLGLGMLAAGPSVGVKGFPGAMISLGQGIGKGGQYALQQEQQERQQAINLANAAMNQRLHEAQIGHLQAQIGQPQVRGETFDPTTFQWIKQYERYNPETGKREPIPLGGATGAAQAGAPKDMEDIPPTITGDEFIAEAKKLGYSAQHLDEAKRAANYEVDPNKLYSSYRGNQRAMIDRLAHRINPDYRPENYKAAFDTTQKLASGDVAKGQARIGRLFDEVEKAASLADKTGNTGYETINELYGKVTKSGSPYQQTRASLETALNDVSDSATAVAKGAGVSAEGEAKRRLAAMNVNMHPGTLKASLYTSAEIALKNGQSNLTNYNLAHGYKPDNPKYKTIMEYLTPAQQKKAVQMLGPEMISEITGKPVETYAGLQEKASPKTNAAPAQQTAPAQVPTPTATGANGEKYILKDGQWVRQ